MEDEIEVLRSIYCKPQENFVLHSKSYPGAEAEDVIFSLDVFSTTSEDNAIRVHASFSIASPYPDTLPCVSMHSTRITKAQCSQLKTDLLNYSESLIGTAMLMEMIMWIQENCDKYASQATATFRDDVNQCNGCDIQMQTALLHLDHMRSKTKYIKTLEKWAAELSLVGSLIFVGKLIAIILQGDSDHVKDFITRQKTVNVDVDSHGRSCKERMLSVLWQEHIRHGQPGFSKFEVVELKSFSDLEAYLKEHQLLHLVQYLPTNR